MAYNSRAPKKSPAQFERLSRVKELSVNVAMRLVELSVQSKIPYTELIEKTFPTIYQKIYNELTASDQTESEAEYEDDDEFYEEQPPAYSRGKTKGR